MKLNSNKGYGWSIIFTRAWGTWSFHLVVNGWVIAFYRGITTKKLTLEVWPNIWRKLQKPIDSSVQ